MKTGIARAVVALIMPVYVFATTLRLSTDIDLLVLDGKKSPAPCCGAQTALSWITARISWFSGGKDHSPRRQRTAGVHFASAGGQL